MSRLQEGQMNTNLKKNISQENCPYFLRVDHYIQVVPLF